ncbi:MAG: hypothetical protein ACLFT9_04530 [Coleofasciculus sp.]
MMVTSKLLVSPLSISEPLAIPPGFEQLSKEQQIDYVQQLWDLIIAVPEQIPVR